MHLTDSVASIYSAISKKKIPGLGLKNEFWAAARAISGYEFWQQIKVMKTVDDGKPTDWLLAISLQ